MDNLANVYDVIALYNQVITDYLGNNTVQTKQIVFSSTRQLLTHVVIIMRGLLHMVERYATNPDNEQRLVRMYFGKLVISFAAYDLIEEQRGSGNIYYISTNELQQRLNA